MKIRKLVSFFLFFFYGIDVLLAISLFKNVLLAVSLFIWGEAVTLSEWNFDRFIDDLKLKETFNVKCPDLQGDALDLLTCMTANCDQEACPIIYLLKSNHVCVWVIIIIGGSITPPAFDKPWSERQGFFFFNWFSKRAGLCDIRWQRSFPLMFWWRQWHEVHFLFVLQLNKYLLNHLKFYRLKTVTRSGKYWLTFKNIWTSKKRRKFLEFF